MPQLPPSESAYYLTAPHAIYSDHELSSTAKWIICEIVNKLRVETRYCWATNDHFAKLFKLKKNNVSYHIGELQKLGWVDIEVVVDCDLEGCWHKGKGSHRHIFPGPRLTALLDPLSSQMREAIQSDENPHPVKREQKDNRKRTEEKTITLDGDETPSSDSAPKKTRAKKDEQTFPEEDYRGVIGHVATIQGIEKFRNYPEEKKWAKKLFELGVTVDEIKAIADLMRSETFWRDQGIGFYNIYKNLDKYLRKLKKSQQVYADPDDLPPDQGHLMDEQYKNQIFAHNELLKRGFTRNIITGKYERA